MRARGRARVLAGKILAGCAVEAGRINLYALNAPWGIFLRPSLLLARSRTGGFINNVNNVNNAMHSPVCPRLNVNNVTHSPLGQDARCYHVNARTDAADATCLAFSFVAPQSLNRVIIAP